ncbi:MAG: hypothetical protein ACHQ4H_05135 [Ktedonobacterales bacterium]
MRKSLPIVLLLCTVVAGCGAASSANAATAPTATSLPTATAAATATPLESTPPPGGASCLPTNYDPSQYVQLGDLLVSKAALSGITYPAAMLPDGTALKPVQLTDGQNPSHDFTSSPPTNPLVDDKHSTGFMLNICNTATAQSHVINSVSVGITRFTPYSGQLSSWQFCDGSYTRAHGTVSGGCGGGIAYDEGLHAGFAPNAGQGASVVAQQSVTSGNAKPLPITLAPGQQLEVLVGISVPTAPGQYTFTFGLKADGHAPVTVNTAPPVLFAPVAHKWTGLACTMPTMLAQIPTAASPVTYWICPAS